MRCLLRLFTLAAGLLSLVATTQAAQDTKSPFALTATPQPDVVDDVMDRSNQLDVRPNQHGEFFLYVYNPLNVTAKYVVELRGTAGSQSQSSVKAAVSVPGKKWKRVRFAKPAAPAAAPLGAPPAVKADPAPPGVKLASDKGIYSFSLQLWDSDGVTEAKLDGGYDSHRDIGVKIRQPSEYIDANGVDVDLSGGNCVTTITLAPKNGRLTPPAAVTLKFQDTHPSTATINSGLYRRTLEQDAITLKGSIRTSEKSPRIYVGVDGIDRAFVYQPETGTEAKGKLILQDKPVTRVYPAAAFKTTAKSQPVTKYPIRIEVDNPPAKASLDLVIQKKGDDTTKDVIPLGPARDEQVWLDTPGPTDDSILITTRSRDWIYDLDLTPYVGEIEISAVIHGDATTQPKFILTVDGTGPKPVGIEVLNLTPKNEHVKGTPLAVAATADEDPGIAIKRAVFFIGKLTDDKKIPADAVVAEGVTDDPARKVWKAKLPLPAVTPDQLTVSVVFYNEVGLAGDEKSITVKLIEASSPAGPGGPATGTITGTVKIGEIRQGGVAVSLRNAEGKEIASTKTADKDDEKTKTKVGDFKFEKVPVGAYTVVSSKPSSSYPFAAQAGVQVKADETTKTTLSMIKAVK